MDLRDALRFGHPYNRIASSGMNRQMQLLKVTFLKETIK
jgi:phage-related protein